MEIIEKSIRFNPDIDDSGFAAFRVRAVPVVRLESERYKALLLRDALHYRSGFRDLGIDLEPAPVNSDQYRKALSAVRHECAGTQGRLGKGALAEKIVGKLGEYLKVPPDLIKIEPFSINGSILCLESEVRNYRADTQAYTRGSIIRERETAKATGLKEDPRALEATFYFSVSLESSLITEATSFENLEVYPESLLSPELALHQRYALPSSIVELARAGYLGAEGSGFPCISYNPISKRSEAYLLIANFTRYFVSEPTAERLRKLVDERIFPPGLAREGPSGFQKRLWGDIARRLYGSGFFVRGDHSGRFIGLADALMFELDPATAGRSLGVLNSIIDDFPLAQLCLRTTEVTFPGDSYQDADHFFNERVNVIPFELWALGDAVGAVFEKAGIPVTTATGGPSRYAQKGLAVQRTAFPKGIPLPGGCFSEFGHASDGDEEDRFYTLNGKSLLYYVPQGSDFAYIWKKRE